MSFRSDINGLRAVAVIAVLLYHFGVPGFGGGYVGVDVFFVISGFLMMQIITTKHAKGQFDLLTFYAARARRILPALAVLVTFLLVGGIFYLPPADYERFGWQAVSALGFFSNIVYSHRGDYFDTSAQEKWLLHTWSLSVEWQFYILLPLFLIGLYRFRRGRFLKRGVIALFIVSLIFSVIATPLQPASAFFVLPTRAWELLAGGLVFLYGGRLGKVPYLSVAGLICILASVCFYSADLEFPGFWAALPVMGAALVIAASSSNRLLDNRPAQFFGAISYSLYLWHWPVMVGAKYFDFPFTALNILLLLFMAVLLATASWSFVENPFRHSRKNVAFGLVGYAVIALLAGTVFFSNGLPSRVGEDVRAAAAAGEEEKVAKQGNCQFDYKKKDTPPDCRIGAVANPSAVIWGDSHVNALAPALSAALTAKKRSAFLYSYAGCPPVLGAVLATKWKKDRCKIINQATYNKTVNDPRVRDVFLIARWSLYLRGYNEKGGPHPYVVFDADMPADKDNSAERAAPYAKNIVETACALTARGKNVYMLAPVPEMGRNVSAALAKSRLIHHRDDVVDVSVEDYRQRNAVAFGALIQATKDCHARVLDPAAFLCDKRSCHGIRDGKSFYSDDNHLNAAGNALIRPIFSKVIN
jgi:peptidoglycan/LPS O-acetylase OafA/YrhL